jgi:transcriptional regulator with XRE-family HTH domain
MNLLGIDVDFMDFESRERLSKAIKRARGARSQRHYSKALGVSYATVRTWEECESFPSRENLELVAESLGQSLEEFLAYLRGEDYQPDERRIRVAEDLLSMADKLSKTEQARLIQLLAGRLIED